MAASLPIFADEPAKTNDVARTNMPPRWPEMKTEKEKISYALGFDMAGFHMQHRDLLDKERMVQGFRDAFDLYRPAMDYEEAKELMEKFEKIANDAEKAKTDQESVQNRRVGMKFLEENLKKEGVKAKPSGLQYKVIKEGTGATPTADGRIRFHYVVKNVKGDLLDDSHRLPKPVAASMTSLIKGWKEGLQMMKEGGVYEFYIPGELAYGEQGAGRNIKGNETLITEVELISVEK